MSSMTHGEAQGIAAQIATLIADWRVRTPAYSTWDDAADELTGALEDMTAALALQPNSENARVEVEDETFRDWTPEFTVWVVREGHSWPMQIDTVFVNEADARARAATRGGKWRAMKYQHIEPHRSATEALTASLAPPSETIARLTAERDEAIKANVKLEEDIEAFNKHDHDREGSAEVWHGIYREQRDRAERAESQLRALRQALKQIKERGHVRDGERPPLVVALERWSEAIAIAEVALASPLVSQDDDQRVIDVSRRQEAGRLSGQLEAWARASSAQGVAVMLRPETIIRAAALLRILAATSPTGKG
jgi:hypothetical protein